MSARSITVGPGRPPWSKSDDAGPTHAGPHPIAEIAQGLRDDIGVPRYSKGQLGVLMQVPPPGNSCGRKPSASARNSGALMIPSSPVRPGRLPKYERRDRPADTGPRHLAQQQTMITRPRGLGGQPALQPAQRIGEQGAVGCAACEMQPGKGRVAGWRGQMSEKLLRQWFLIDA